MIAPLKFLVVYASMTAIDVLLKVLVNKAYFLPGDWLRYYKSNMTYLKERNTFMWLLILLAGAISNLALLGLIISIPLYFIL